MVRFVVMASGQATRMGQDKLSLPWKNTTVLAYVLKTIRESLKLLDPSFFEVPAEIWVVARKTGRVYLKGLNEPEEGVFKQVWINQPTIRPLSETIRLGLADLPQESAGICFVPADQVGLEPRILADLIRCFLEKRPDFLIPSTEGCAGIKGKGKTGSPVFFHRRYLEDLRSLQGEQGGRAVLKQYPERWLTYPVPETFMEDIDTPEDYRRLAALTKMN